MNEVMKMEQETELRDKELDKVDDLLRWALMDLSYLFILAEGNADEYEVLIRVWDSIVKSAGIILSYQDSRASANSSTSDEHCDHQIDREG
jgi:hypothetical protein